MDFVYFCIQHPVTNTLHAAIFQYRSNKKVIVYTYIYLYLYIYIIFIYKIGKVKHNIHVIARLPWDSSLAIRTSFVHSVPEKLI